MTFENNYCHIYNQKGKLVATADLVDGVYKLRIKKINCLLTSISIWHKRFGHINSKDLNLMRDGAVHGLLYKDNGFGEKQ